MGRTCCCPPPPMSQQVLWRSAPHSDAPLGMASLASAVTQALPSRPFPGLGFHAEYLWTGWASLPGLSRGVRPMELSCGVHRRPGGTS